MLNQSRTAKTRAMDKPAFLGLDIRTKLVESHEVDLAKSHLRNFLYFIMKNTRLNTRTEGLQNVDPTDRIKVSVYLDLSGVEVRISVPELSHSELDLLYSVYMSVKETPNYVGKFNKHDLYLVVSVGDRRAENVREETKD